MENKLTIPIKIQMSDCDYAQVLSYPGIFSYFQNIATEHSRLFHYDASVLTPRGLFWVTSKSKVRIYSRPAENDTVELSTWPEKPNRIRGRRYYTIESNGKRLIEATTEWVVLNRNTGRFYLINDLYDPDFEFCPEKTLPEDFIRFSDDFTGEPFAEYKVRSVDIDYEGHMNNVAYIRAMFGLFSRAELDKMNPRELEVQYKVSCYEGDRLLWYRRDTAEGTDLCARLEDQTVIFYARLRRELP